MRFGVNSIGLFFMSPTMKFSPGGLSSVTFAALLFCLIPAVAMPAEKRDMDHRHSAAHAHGDGHSHDNAHSHEKSQPEGLSPKSFSGVVRLLVIYSVFIGAASLLGGVIPGRLRISHNGMQHLISGVCGLMLGIAIFHLLPHAIHHTGAAYVDQICLATMTGIAVMFFLLRAFHFHQHGVTEDVQEPHARVDCQHHHAHQFSWIGIFLGLGLHTIMDGIALGASVVAEYDHSPLWNLAGVGTFLAIALHQPLDSMSFTSLMIAGGWTRWTILLANACFALLCPLGALLFVGGINIAGIEGNLLIALALAFSAGVFLCIALSDLLPEMEFHSHNRFTLSTCLLLGIAAAWSLGFLESQHVHP